jgi:GT2 family glycosyltransferase
MSEVSGVPAPSADGIDVSVVIVSYRSGPSLLRCVSALDAEGDEGVEAIVVENGSSGPELEEVERFERVRVLRPGSNLGFAAGCNLGSGEASGSVLVFLNPDTVAAPGAIRALAATLRDDSIGIAMGQLLLLDRPTIVNSLGCEIHVSGLGWSKGYGEVLLRSSRTAEITYANGSAMAMRTADFRRLGGFTDRLFMYHEDLELGWRARMDGLKIVLNPDAHIFHEYDYDRNELKNYFMERNRLIFVASAYSGRLVTVLFPLLVATELAMLALALKEGWLRQKLAGWLWCVRNVEWLRDHRRSIQRQRRLSDRELSGELTARIDPAIRSVPRLVKAVNPLVSIYWALARKAL